MQSEIIYTCSICGKDHSLLYDENEVVVSESKCLCDKKPRKLNFQEIENELRKFGINIASKSKK